MITVDNQDLKKVHEKISNQAKNKENGPSEKKVKYTKHIRARARLPVDPSERAKYELPEVIKDAGLKEMLLAMLKTIANSQQRVRVLESVVADNFMIPSEHPAVTAGVTTAETYQKTAIRTTDSIGAPGPQVLYHFAAALLEHGGLSEVSKTNIKDHVLTPLQGAEQDHATKVVSVFSIRPAYDPQFYKIVMVSPDSKVRTSVTKALTDLKGVKHFTAPAPASGQEDEIQKWIEKLESL